MISGTAEYALRAVVHLAAVSGEQPLQTVEQIAAGTRVPTGYLAKVLQSLTRAGVLTSQRGAGGGFRLANDPAKISVYEVVQSVDPIRRIHQCPLGLDQHSTHLCPLHKGLDNAMLLIEAQFRATTIAALIELPDHAEDQSSDGGTCRLLIGSPTRVSPAIRDRAASR